MDVFVGSEKKLETMTFGKPYIHITIRSRLLPGWVQEPIRLLPDPNRVAVLYMVFDDCEAKDRFIGKPLLKKEARLIWDFFEKYQERVELLVVNCEAGLSRSPGVAAAIFTAMGEAGKAGLDYTYRKPFQQNVYVKKVLLATHPTNPQEIAFQKRKARLKTKTP